MRKRVIENITSFEYGIAEVEVVKATEKCRISVPVSGMVQDGKYLDIMYVSRNFTHELTEDMEADHPKIIVPENTVSDLANIEIGEL